MMMSTSELIAAIITRFQKKRFWIIGISVFFMLFFIIYAWFSPVTYTSTATIFPLTSGSNQGTGSSILSTLLGNSDVGNSFTNENSVSIIELAKSRTIREEVARKRIPEAGDKTIAELMKEGFNNNHGLFETNVDLKPDDPSLIDWAAQSLFFDLDATITPTNSFQLQYTGRSTDLVTWVSYAFVNKISEFYIELKIEKARNDFQFATKKVDSLRKIMGVKDQDLISLDDKSLFTDVSKLKYRIPTENLLTDKQLLSTQYASAVSNQQSAAYVLQKATPVVKLLDKPDPPFLINTKSKILYGAAGLIGGLMIILFVLTVPLIVRFVHEEISRILYSTKSAKTNP